MTNFSLSFAPMAPWSIMIALAAAAAIVTALALYARRRGALLRGLGLALVWLALADPSLVREDRQPLKDVVAVVLDRSASQGLGPRKAQTDAAREKLEAALAALGDIETRVIEAAGEPRADGTQIFAGLANGLSDVPPERVGAVFIVTDGQVHDIPANAGALGFKAPLHALVTGREGERDRRVELVEAPRFGLVGKDQMVQLRVVESGGSGAPAPLRVLRDGKEIARVTARPGDRIRVPVRIEHGGPNVVEIEAAALADELTLVNNKAVLTIEGVRDKLKVLLVSGEPHAGERAWRNLLKSDANVELVHFTILRPPEKQDGTPISELSLIAFPTADLFGAKIREFDLIVFDRYSNQSVLPTLYFDNIVRYVRDGGALLIAAGPDYGQRDGLFHSPIGRMAPARPTGVLTEQPFRARVSDEGKKHPVTRALPGSQSEPPGWSPWFRQIEAETQKGGVAVLSGLRDKPLLVLSREDRGRVALLLSDQMWLWSRGYEGGGPHVDLQRRLAHWLMKEPDLEEEALRAQARGREIVVTRQSLKARTGDVEMTTPSGATSRVALTADEPGLASATITAEELGLYRFTDGALSALAHVGPENPREFQDVVSTTDKLRPLAEATGGTARRLATQGDDVALPRLVAMRESPIYGGADYAGVKRTQASVAVGIGISPLAIGLLGLVALLGSLILAWGWEGRRR